MELFLYRDVTRFLAKTESLFSQEMWKHLYIEMIPHFLRKQFFHLKYVLFCLCNQYGINSITVIDASLWIHLQEGIIIVLITANSPKHDPYLKDACIFNEKLKWPTSIVKKH